MYMNPFLGGNVSLSFLVQIQGLSDKIAQSCLTLLRPCGLWPANLCPWDSPRKKSGAGCHFLLRWIFWTQGSNLRLLHWKVKVKSLSSTICDPMDCSLPGSSIHGISQARVLEWVAISAQSTLKKSDPSDLLVHFCHMKT
ncbi:hypothetical protein R6Z07F_006019 [Ovis aries]